MKFLRDQVVGAVPGLNGAFFPLFIPQGRKPPAAVYTVVDRSRQSTYSGTGALVESIVNVDVVAARYVEARDLADAIRGALVDFKGDMHGTDVQGVFITADQDTSDIEPGFFRTTLTFNIWYQETSA